MSITCPWSSFCYLFSVQGGVLCARGSAATSIRDGGRLQLLCEDGEEARSLRPEALPNSDLSGSLPTSRSAHSVQVERSRDLSSCAFLGPLISSLLEIGSDVPSYRNKSNKSLSRSDRIFFALLGWCMTQPRFEHISHADPMQLITTGFSDHSPVGVRIAEKKTYRKEFRPIPTGVMRHKLFSQHFEKLVNSVRIKSLPPGEKIVEMKKMMREAADIVEQSNAMPQEQVQCKPALLSLRQGACIE